MTNRMEYILGNEEILATMPGLAAREPFSAEILEFCTAVSKELMRAPEGKGYPDIITLGFWLRKGSTEALRKRFLKEDGDIRLGRGVVFHVAPSNVPVNFAYSLFAGLLCGNANVVRIPSKDFPQVGIIVEAMKKALQEHPGMSPYICLVRYGHEQEINDRLSSLCDVRIIWGGDATIAEIRKSPLQPRATEVAFADRFSLAVIDSDAYMERKDKDRLAEGFYNDTYLTDQNACTSPRLVAWLGGRKEEAKTEFWRRLHELAWKKYAFQPIQGIDKLAGCFLLAAGQEGVRVEAHGDNLLVRVRLSRLEEGLMEKKGNSGYFFEYDCENVLELRGLCNDKGCQTVAYVGEKDMLQPLVDSGVKGIDRVASVGHTMDFDLLWDGYDLSERLTRHIVING